MVAVRTLKTLQFFFYVKQES